MNDILLIEKINLHAVNNPIYEMYYVLGNMSSRELSLQIIELVDKCEYLNKEDILFKKDGLKVKIRLDNIPKLTKLLAENGVLIYSVYRTYNPAF